MKKIIFTIACCVALMLSSCSTITKTSTTANVQTGIYQYPTVADLEVKGKIEKTIEWNFVPFHLGEPSLALAKGNLIADALKEYDADVMLEPQFVFSRTRYGERVLTLTGFPSKLKNFRTATPNDIEVLKANIEPTSRTVYNVSKTSSKGLFGGLFNLFKK